MAYHQRVKFVETSVFTRQITGLTSDDEYRLLQESLLRRLVTAI